MKPKIAFVHSIAFRSIKSHLFHKPSLAITIRVNHGVQFIQKTRLLRRIVSCVLMCPRARSNTRTTLVRACAGTNTRPALMRACAGTNARPALMRACARTNTRPALMRTCTRRDTRPTLGMAVVKISVVNPLWRLVMIDTLFAILVREMIIDTGALTLEGIEAFLTAAQDAATLLVFSHVDWGKSGGSMVLGSIVVSFVDRNSGVDNIWLNSFFMNYRLNGLVQVVVHMLALNDGSIALGVVSIMHNLLVLELLGLGSQRFLCMLMVSVVEVSMLYST